MSQKQILGLIDFPFSFRCSKEVLGKSVKISIGEITAKITFPSYPYLEDDKFDLLARSLDSPILFKNLSKGGKPIQWGEIVTSQGSSIIESATLEFMVPSDQVEVISKEVYAEFENWLKLFEQYVRLLTSQITRLHINTFNGYENALSLFSNSESTLNYISAHRTTCLRGSLADAKNDLTLKKLQECCRLASSGYEPKLEYKLLLEADNARNNNDYRKAIIEAATALEVSLTKKLLDEFLAKNISFGNELLKKFRMLGGKFTLCKIVGIQLPTNDYEKMIIEPRNNVIHKSVFPDRQDANKVISEVEKYLHAFSPIFHEDT